MKSTIFNIDELLNKGYIESEYELEQALHADRQLRLLVEENPSLEEKRSKLREFIIEYESKHWSLESKISDAQMEESDQAEILVEKERQFIQKRKRLIKSKLKRLTLNQQEFGKILGHNSKSYMSELMNGVSPFILKDLIVISKLLKINLSELVFTNLSFSERKEIEQTVKKLKKPKLILDKKDFAFG